MAQDVIVETRNLTKTYRDFWGRKKKTALNALDLTRSSKGEIFGLLGPNGSGKTTTIKLLLGLLFASSGEGYVFGEPAAKVEKNERIGYLPEESYLYRFLNAEETLDFYGRLFNIPAECAPDPRRGTHRRGRPQQPTRSASSASIPRGCGSASAWRRPSSTTPTSSSSTSRPRASTRSAPRWMKDLILDLKQEGQDDPDVQRTGSTTCRTCATASPSSTTATSRSRGR